MTAMELMESKPESKQEELRQGYEKYIKGTVNTELKPLNPEQWLGAKLNDELEAKRIENKAIQEANKTNELVVNEKFKKLMYNAGFGGIVERARFLALGKV